jgi:hypothetical protein
VAEELQGYVYFIASRRATKVGWSRDPRRRLRSLQTGNPEQLFLIAQVQGTKKDERRIHEALRGARLGDSEWFRSSSVTAYLAGADVPTILDRQDTNETPASREAA